MQWITHLVSQIHVLNHNQGLKWHFSGKCFSGKRKMNLNTNQTSKTIAESSSCSAKLSCFFPPTPAGNTIGNNRSAL